MEMKPIDKYVEAIISGRTTGYGYIETLDDKWIDILCGFAKETNEENFLNKMGIKNPVNAKDLENWTLAVTHSGDTIPYEVFTNYAVKVVKYLEQHEGEY